MKWKDSDLNAASQGKSPWTRFKAWINNLMNPNHAWEDYSQAPETDWSNSVTNQFTKQHLTGAEQEANAFSSAEAQRQRDWEAEMQNTAYQRQVADMRAAGVNPAIAMNNGQPSTPSGASASSVSPGTSGVSMSDLMQALLLPMNKKILSAQAKNIEADTQKKQAETGQIQQVMEFYPHLTEATISELLSRSNLNLANINKTEAEQALVEVDKVIKDKQNKYADDYYYWQAEFEKAKTQEAKDSAAAHAASAAWQAYETSYTQLHNGARPSSSGILAVVDAITSWLGIHDDGSVSGTVAKAVIDGVNSAVETVSDPQAAGRKAAGTPISLARWKNRAQRFRNWVNKEKKAPWVK